jgi:hypothetical protein
MLHLEPMNEVGFWEVKVLVMNRLLTVLLTIALLSWTREESAGQDTAAMPERVPEVNPLSGDILIWRAQSRKADKVTQVSKITPQDRVGTVGGNPGRISIDADCMVTLKGVTATEGDGLSVTRIGKVLTVRLHHGRILVETFAVDFALETPNGRVEGKSVYFLAEVGRESTRIVAIDGELKVSTDLGKMDLGGGETVTVRKGTEPAKGPPADPDRDLAGVAAAEEPVNLIKNSGFELGLKDWFPLRYDNKPLATIDEKIVHGGKKSVRIQIPNIALSPEVVPFDAAGDGRTALYTLLDVKTLKTGARYLLRFWVRTEDYAIDGKPVPFSFVTRGLVLPEQKGQFFSPCSCPPSEKKWRCVRFVLEAEPPGVNRFGMNFPDFKNGVFSGTVWLDDFFLAPLPVKSEEKPSK